MDEQNFKKTVQDTFDKASPGYDLPEIRFFAVSAEYMTGLLPLHGGESILDVCTGTGQVVKYLLPRLPAGSVTGVDISSGMLSVAGKRFATEGKRVRFVHADLEEFKSDRVFDHLFCAFGIFFFPDMARALEKMKTLVASGGKMVFSTFALPFMQPQMGLFGERLGKYGLNPVPSPWMEISTEDKLRGFLSKAGFEDVKIHAHDCSYVLENPEQWWTMVVNTNLRVNIAPLSSGKLDEFRREHLAEVAAVYKGKGVRCEVHVLYAVVSV